jgi:heme exporter protein D
MSWPDVMSMGGYAFYVWGSYALTLVAMSAEVWLLLRRHKAWQVDVEAAALRGNRQTRV